ncbi:MAG: hypothetical protein LBV51_04895 [Acholeplasmatales bacterium]|jgi:hypothetical protein|nr:hypothetical protein [Acholeplasmatales bacterium]
MWVSILVGVIAVSIVAFSIVFNLVIKKKLKGSSCCEGRDNCSGSCSGCNPKKITKY